ncbi:MAG: hypothetical protein GEV13_10670 [Rhodospirillales bacterium]|nr:hypothetical protein [Rhodospirillales bacterium]
MVREQIAKSTHVGTTEEDRRIFQALHNLEREISAAAHALLPLRQAHGRRVEQALAPEMRAAAAAALAAIAEAEAALGRLNELREQLRLVGRAASSLSNKPLLVTRLQIEDVMRKGEVA